MSRAGTLYQFETISSLCFATIYIQYCFDKQKNNDSVMQLLDRLAIGTLIVMGKPKDSRLGMRYIQQLRSISYFSCCIINLSQ